jgi:clan AA aspartic protease (TIGR02281 family)
VGSRQLLALGLALLVGAVGYGAWHLGRLSQATTPESWTTLMGAPQESTAWQRFGAAQQERGALDVARAAYRAAIELDPRDGDPHARLGFLLYEAGHDAQALAELHTAQQKGSSIELVEMTLSMMRSHVELDGPFPRFTPGGARAAPPDSTAQKTAPPSPPAAAADADDADDEDADDDAVAEPAPAEDPAPEERASADEEVDDDEPDGDEEVDDDDAHDDEAAEEEEAVDERPVSVDEDCELALERRGRAGTFLVDVEVDGVEARLILDTGASLTVLSRAFLERTGLRLDEDGEMLARTAAGPQRFATAELEGVEVSGRTVSGVRVAICEDCGAPGYDGLLGLDVQGPLGMSLHPARGVARFADCEEE